MSINIKYRRNIFWINEKQLLCILCEDAGIGKAEIAMDLINVVPMELSLVICKDNMHAHVAFPTN
jgi:hypothetical protein